MKKIAIIGAGIAGLTCASELDKEQYNITIFDKRRGKGGRVSTRREGDFHFDHGAQYISEPKEKEFKLKFEDWLDRGIVQKWDGNLGEMKRGKYNNSFETKNAYVGVPKMSILANDLADTLDGVIINQPVTITSIFKKFDEWYLEDEKGNIHGGYKFIVFAIPAYQAKSLLRDYEYLVKILDKVETSPRWACMIGLEKKLELSYDAVYLEEIKNYPIFSSPIRWIARNSSKPGRPENEAWVVHATKTWSEKHLEKSEDWVADELIEAFTRIVRYDDLPITYKNAHLWRYGLVDQSLNQHFVLDNNRNIALTGDYCMGNNIEAAFVSGKMLGQRVNNLRV